MGGRGLVSTPLRRRRRSLVKVRYETISNPSQLPLVAEPDKPAYIVQPKVNVVDEVSLAGHGADWIIHTRL